MSDMHRFYFDDGQSRKRWYVQSKGKSQLVQYGRLGGSLKESKKSFKSPAEAAEQTAKLIAKKKGEGYVEINPSRLEITRSKGKRNATEAQIQSLEKRIGCSLPEEYREFLRTVNGGTPNPDCVQVPGVPGIDNVGVGVLFYLQPSKPAVNELTYELDHTAELLPGGHLPIAGSSDVFTLSLKPKTFGAVYWWFHETDDLDDEGHFHESAGYLLAGSFDEFLTRIALLYGDDEEPVVDGSAAESGTKERIAKNKSTVTLKGLLRLVNHDHTPTKVQEIEQTANELGDISGIQDGDWPFTNIGNPRVVRCLLKAGLNPEITDKEKHSLLWQCAGNEECVDLLLKRGVNVDRRSGRDHETALMRAIFLEAIPAVTRLLQAGADPTVRLSGPIQHKLDSNTKLRQLIEKARAEWRKNKGKKKPPQKIVKPNSPTSQKSSKSKPTLSRLLRLMKHDYLTDQCDEVSEIEQLVMELGDVSGIQDGEWPTIDKFESPRLLTCLLEAGLNPEITDKGGNSLLCQCVTHPDSISLLIEYGVDVDRRSGRDDGTALMRATWKGDQECVQRLLDAGADPTLEFNGFAKLMLDMDEEMMEFIETACAAWHRKARKKKSAGSK